MDKNFFKFFFTCRVFDFGYSMDFPNIVHSQTFFQYCNKHYEYHDINDIVA